MHDHAAEPGTGWTSWGNLVCVCNDYTQSIEKLSTSPDPGEWPSWLKAAQIAYWYYFLASRNPYNVHTGERTEFRLYDPPAEESRGSSSSLEVERGKDHE